MYHHHIPPPAMISTAIGINNTNLPNPGEGLPGLCAPLRRHLPRPRPTPTALATLVFQGLICAVLPRAQQHNTYCSSSLARWCTHPFFMGSLLHVFQILAQTEHPQGMLRWPHRPEEIALV